MKKIFLCLLAIMATLTGCQPENGVTGIPGPPGPQGPAGPPGPAGVNGNLTALNRSGDRIRAQYLEGADGSKVLAGWFDTERQEACEWKPIETTKQPLGCFPNKKIVAYTYLDLFAEPTCKTPVYNGPFAGVYWVDLSTMQVYTKGATMAIGDPYYQKVGAACQYSGMAFNDSFWYGVSAGSVEDLWVTGTLVTD